ncbi:questin oxidase family protein [bacterium]|nr:questin oxidase family protein [bacterium]
MLAQRLIQKHNAQYSTYYKTQLYTHTPMALLALKEMGASDKRLESFYQKSAAKLRAKSASSLKIASDNWREHLGNHEYETAYVQFFKTEMQHLGQDKMIAHYFDQLMPGVAAAAFHPLIRLFYAVRFNIKEEIVISLASWATSYLDLGLDSKLTNTVSMLDLLKRFREQDFNQGKKIVAPNIAQRMAIVAHNPMFKDLSAQLFYDDLEASKLESALLWLFSQNNNFTLLHAITSHHAFEALQKFSAKPKIARILMWKALLAAYLSTTGSIEVDFDWQYPDMKFPDWPKLTAKAIQSNEEHVIKLVHILSIKNRKDIDQRLRYGAALKMGLIE